MAESEYEPYDSEPYEDGLIDLGHGHSMRFFAWKPDRELNPQCAHLPDVERAGAVIYHPHQSGQGSCASHISWRTIGARCAGQEFVASLHVPFL